MICVDPFQYLRLMGVDFVLIFGGLDEAIAPFGFRSPQQDCVGMPKEVPLNRGDTGFRSFSSGPKGATMSHTGGATTFKKKS